jgi:ATP-dependent RNA helicase RhlE
VKAGITSAAIHGNKSQGARTKALANFKSGAVRVLVATDIAARGLDIPLLPHVINFELPNIAEDYVHRIGRTGRAGASGEAISLVDINEVEYVQGIEKLLGEKLSSEVIEGFEPTAKLAQNKPKQNSRRNTNRNKSRNSKPKNPGSGGNSNSRRNNNRGRR